MHGAKLEGVSDLHGHLNKLLNLAQFILEHNLSLLFMIGHVFTCGFYKRNSG